uniref:NADH dehydrogenase subunit 4L n=1 Tax=Ctenolepisma longicaudatum TaxID=27554 RepID=UPI0024359FAB|nr:NADH dehydrogenase subunit 4L [Ctenolepisma longicaudatum]WEX31829.1 NADH dehydrogenase subunit 4L [Ctenolepisma longicaudatum]
MSTFVFPICSCLLVMVSMWCFVNQRKHLLMVLLSLEMIVLSMFLLLFLSLSEFYSEITFNLLFLTFCVCEGSLGLSILVSIVRSHGNDYLDSLVVLQC